jgi:hypothetical protein
MIMNEWERREFELQRQENAWFEKVNPLMKMVDNPFMFFFLLFLVGLISVGLGLFIGSLL